MSPVARERTPSGPGAVAVVELCGADAGGRLRELGVAPPGPGSPCLVRLVDGDETLDEALCIAHSEEHFELHLHGSPAVVRRVLGALRAEPWPPARSLEERAEVCLARTRSEAGARILLDQTQGALRRSLEALDLSDGPALRRDVATLVEAGRVTLCLVEPPRVVLAGPTNAGKSTLFNLLMERERVVVDATAGTTRDAIFEPARFGAYAVDLGDLAGERELPASAERGAEDELELEGQKRALAWAFASDLVFWLSPALGPVRPPASSEGWGGELCCVVTRTDESPETLRGTPAISSHSDPDQARRTIEGLFHRALELPTDPWQPGRAAPFDPSDLSRLEELARAPYDARAGILESLLAC